MPATRGINLRSGDLAEQLGLLILQNLALVAPIPRTEDVGVDSVVTLLERHNKKSYIATDSFFIQIKSISSKNVKYKRNEIKWLFDLELPFFIGRVDQSQLSIDLYCCHRLSEAYLGHSKKRNNLIINFEDYKDGDYFITNNNVSVGPPVFSISLHECKLAHKRDEFIKMCKSHIAAENFNLQHRKAGIIKNLSWGKSGIIEVNPVVPFKSIENGNTLELDNVLRHAEPYIISLAFKSLANWDASRLEKVIKDLEEVRNLINLSDEKNTEFQGDIYNLVEGDNVPLHGGFAMTLGENDALTYFDAKKFFSGKE